MTSQRRNFISAVSALSISAFIFIALMLIITLNKSGFYEDEISTFALANCQYDDMAEWGNVQSGAVYSGGEFWTEYFTVAEGHEFDYENVWKNQAQDVHPPLYYVFVHTICSFTPGELHVGALYALNVLFAIIVFWQMVWLFKRFTDKNALAYIFSLLFIFSMPFVDITGFLRMYALLTVWTNALVILFLRYRPKDMSAGYFVKLVLVLLGGIMTHYYFIVFAFFACVMYAVRVLRAKNYGKVIISTGCVCAAFVLATLIFPAMWQHILTGYRGDAALRNFFYSENTFSDFWTFLSFINKNLFGGLFPVLVAVSVIFAVFACRKEKPVFAPGYKEGIMDALQIAVPVILYILVISAASPDKAFRYEVNITGLAYLIVFAMVAGAAEFYSAKGAIAAVLLGVLTLAAGYVYTFYPDSETGFLFYSDSEAGVPDFYSEERENIETLDGFGRDTPVLFVLNEDWYPSQYTPNLVEVKDFDEITFVKKYDTEVFEEKRFHDYDELILYVVNVGCEPEETVRYMLEINDGLEQFEELYSFGYTTTYYLH